MCFSKVWCSLLLYCIILLSISSHKYANEKYARDAFNLQKNAVIQLKLAVHLAVKGGYAVVLSVFVL